MVLRKMKNIFIPGEFCVGGALSVGQLVHRLSPAINFCVSEKGRSRGFPR